MSEDGLVWGVLAVLMAMQLPMLMLSFAPGQFWLNLHHERPRLAAFLWGYSHPFGPRRWNR